MSYFVKFKLRILNIFLIKIQSIKGFCVTENDNIILAKKYPEEVDRNR